MDQSTSTAAQLGDVFINLYLNLGDPYFEINNILYWTLEKTTFS